MGKFVDRENMWWEGERQGKKLDGEMEKKEGQAEQQQSIDG